MKKHIAAVLFMTERTANARGGMGEVLFIGAIGAILLMVIIAITHLLKKEKNEAKESGLWIVKAIIYLAGFSIFVWSLGSGYGLWVIGAMVVVGFILKQKDKN